MKRLIVIAGLRGSGKTEAVKGLLRSVEITAPAIILSFATPMKKMLALLGVPHKNLYGTEEEKYEPLEVLEGKSARHAMVTIATEWGRDMIGPNIWTKAMKHQLDKVSDDVTVLIDDLRFQNEYDLCRELGATILGIERHKTPVPMFHQHISEQLPYRFEELGIPIIKNEGTIADLHQKVVALTTLSP